jgi:hypothetical protein
VSISHFGMEAKEFVLRKIAPWYWAAERGGEKHQKSEVLAIFERVSYGASPLPLLEHDLSFVIFKHLNVFDKQEWSARGCSWKKDVVAGRPS